MQDLTIVLEAIHDFKEIATSLVHELCSKAGITLNDKDLNFILREKFGKQKEHDLNSEWTFCLHGAECRFTNNSSNLNVEVIMIYGDQCGALDTYFFYLFCKGTPKYSILSNRYKNQLDVVLQDFEQLFREGHLFKLDDKKDVLERNLTA
jgi:hypothetical protein